MKPQNAVTGVGVALAAGGGIAALSLFPAAHRSCTVPGGSLDQARATAFANQCMGHGIGFVVAVAVLVLGGFVLVNGVALSVHTMARQRVRPIDPGEGGPGRELEDWDPPGPTPGTSELRGRADVATMAPAMAGVAAHPRGEGPLGGSLVGQDDDPASWFGSIRLSAGTPG